MNERMEVLRNKLYQAIDAGKANEILKVSAALDIEIVKAMIMINKVNKTMSCDRNDNNKSNKLVY